MNPFRRKDRDGTDRGTEAGSDCDAREGADTGAGEGAGQPGGSAAAGEGLSLRYDWSNISLRYDWSKIQSYLGSVQHSPHLHVTYSTFGRPTSTPAELPSAQATEPIVAVRWWRLRQSYPDGFRLRSVNAYHEWMPFERHQAVCRWDRDQLLASGHKAPHLGCQCGIYAMAERIDMPDDEDGPFVLGEVYLWGRVIEAEHGYRAQFAYPKRLHVVNGNDRIATELSLTYGVPCERWS